MSIGGIAKSRFSSMGCYCLLPAWSPACYSKWEKKAEAAGPRELMVSSLCISCGVLKPGNYDNNASIGFCQSSVRLCMIPDSAREQQVEAEALISSWQNWNVLHGNKFQLGSVDK